MRVVTITYLPAAQERGVGDLYLPDAPACGTPLALTIHGGGWTTQDKASFAGVAAFLCELGFAAFNINYRLLTAGPWPLCGDDCLAAAGFLLHGEIPELAGFDRSRLFITGASAGGHLALMTGLRMPREAVSGIVSIAGVDDLTAWPPAVNGTHQKPFFGKVPDAGEIAAANPMSLIRHGQPPVLLTHSIHDTVVSCLAAENFAARCREVGAPVEFYRYDRREPGISHCIWIPDSSPHKLYPDLEAVIAKFAEPFLRRGEQS